MNIAKNAIDMIFIRLYLSMSYILSNDKEIFANTKIRNLGSKKKEYRDVTIYCHIHITLF